MYFFATIKNPDYTVGMRGTTVLKLNSDAKVTNFSQWVCIWFQKVMEKGI